VTKEEAAAGRDYGAIAFARNELHVVDVRDEACRDAYGLDRLMGAGAKPQEQHIEVGAASKIDAVCSKKRCLGAGCGHKQASLWQEHAVLQERVTGSNSGVVGEARRLDKTAKLTLNVVARDRKRTHAMRVKMCAQHRAGIDLHERETLFV